MARPPAWFDRLDDLIDQLRTSSLHYLGRKEVSAIFGFQHDRDGFRLLEKFGAENIDNRLSLPRTRLLAELEALRSGPVYAAWLNNRAEVAEKLRKSQHERAPKRFSVPLPPAPAPPQLEKLPTTIRWQRTSPSGAARFEVLYDNGADLLRQLAEFLRAVGANREKFTRATEPDE